MKSCLLRLWCKLWGHKAYYRTAHRSRYGRDIDIGCTRCGITFRYRGECTVWHNILTGQRARSGIETLLADFDWLERQREGQTKAGT